MGDPFAQTPAPPPSQGSGFLGIPQSSWQNLANFGAQTSVAANARTPQGFLEYGSGLAGPLGAGMLGAEKQAQQTAESMSGQGLQQAQTESAHVQTLMNELQIPKLEALNRYYQSPQFAQDMGFAAQSGASPAIPAAGDTGVSNPSHFDASAQGANPNSNWARSGSSGALAGAAPPQSGGVGWASATGTTQGSPGMEGVDSAGNAIINIESRGNPGARNQQGYSGLFGFGTARLQSDGMYTPAPGEDISQNSWGGTIKIPGYEPMSYPQFMQNPQAQAAAFNVSEANSWKQIQANHIDSAIGMNVGGVQITQPALIGLAHIGGVDGAQKFILSGGRYNPPDSNGVRMSDYANMVNQQVLGSQQQNYNHQTQANAQDTPGPFIPPGGVTPAKAQELVGQLSQQLARKAAAGLPTAGLQAQIDMYKQMAAGPYSNMDMRANGGGIVGGNFVKMSGPTKLAGAGGAEYPAAEYGGYSVNGQEQSPASVSLANMPPGSAPPGSPTQPPPQSGPMVQGQQGTAPPPPQPYAQNPVAPPPQGPPGGAIPTFGGKPTPAPSSTDAQFDAALMGHPMPQDQQTGALYAQVPIGTEEVMKNGTERIDQQQEGAETSARSAVQSNALLQNMRNESRSWTSDAFANWKNDGRKYMSAIGHSLGMDTTMFDQQVGDFATFNKNAQYLIQERVRAVSSRASQQEFGMIANSMPNPNIGNNGLTQITSELQGLNDYTIAYNQGMSNWRKGFAAMTPGQQYAQTLSGFDAPFIQRVTPYPFMLNALTQTPEGLQQFQGLVHNLQGTKEGQAELARLAAQMQYARQSGLMQASGGGTGQ
jgi:hypothetical protein